ncbi:MAG TPA: hypothetical protein VGP30_02405 [Candidatus Limnocylindrales bacterium]|nr:hypothetical protein [Candidatus Limnocylindrales bacterium]
MNLDVLLPGLTSLLAAVFALALLDQWLQRRRAYQIVWAAGMAFFAIAAGCEAVAAATGWTEPLYRTWYLTGAVWTAGWLGLGTGYLLGRTRFGYTFAICIFLAGLFTFLAARRLPAAEVGDTPLLYVIVAGVVALAVAVETYFQNERWPYLAALAVGGATAISLVVMLTITLPAPGYALDPATGIPTATIIPASLRLLTPFLNITGGLALILGALFSAYVFMPKRRVLDYSLDASQSGDQFLFNLFIAPVAIAVNFAASLPGAVRALVTGRIHSRVPATLMIALGALVASSTDTLNRFGSTDLFQIGKFVGVVLLFAGFLVSIEVFREIRVPFTGIVLRAARSERAEAGSER